MAQNVVKKALFCFFFVIGSRGLQQFRASNYRGHFKSRH